MRDGNESLNRDLGAARAAKKDEFYTQYVDIQTEVEAYLGLAPFPGTGGGWSGGRAGRGRGATSRGRGLRSPVDPGTRWWAPRGGGSPVEDLVDWTPRDR